MAIRSENGTWPNRLILGQSCDALDRMWRKEAKIEARLGVFLGVLGYPETPKPLFHAGLQA